MGQVTSTNEHERERAQRQMGQATSSSIAHHQADARKSNLMTRFRLMNRADRQRPSPPTPALAAGGSLPAAARCNCEPGPKRKHEHTRTRSVRESQRVLSWQVRATGLCRSATASASRASCQS
eukprot:1032721-Prymnesium_polylepis.1